MGLGIITGSEILKNRDSEKSRLLLQVKMVSEISDIPADVRTVELLTQAGEDTNPAKNSRVYVVEAAESYQIGIAVSDDVVPTVNPGEKEIYSTDSPATTKKARIKLSSNGDIEISNDVKSSIIKLDGTGIEITDGVNTLSITMDATGIALESGDAAGWLPNVQAVDPVTGIPHGGAGGGIIKLKGA